MGIWLRMKMDDRKVSYAVVTSRMHRSTDRIKLALRDLSAAYLVSLIETRSFAFQFRHELI